MMEKLGKKLGGVKEQISAPIPPKSDLNTYTKEGMYYIGADGISITNTPFSTNSFSLVVIKNAFYVDGVTQIFIDYQSPKIYSRNYTGQPLQWNEWAGYMTNQCPTDVQLPLTPEWQNRHGGCFYNVEQNGRVTVTIGATTVDTAGASGSMIIGRLPTEYAPKKTFYFPCVSSYKAITGYVTTSGSVGVLSDELITVAYGQFSFFLQ